MQFFLERAPNRFRPVLELTRRQWKLIGLGLAIVAGAGGLVLAVVRTQGAVRLSVANHDSVKVLGPVEVDLGQEVAGGFVPTLEPAVRGEWEERRSILGVSRAV